MHSNDKDGNFYINTELEMAIKLGKNIIDRYMWSLYKKKKMRILLDIHNLNNLSFKNKKKLNYLKMIMIETLLIIILGLNYLKFLRG
jgi:hypothetical protein